MKLFGSDYIQPVSVVQVRVLEFEMMDYGPVGI